MNLEKLVAYYRKNILLHLTLAMLLLLVTGESQSIVGGKEVADSSTYPFMVSVQLDSSGSGDFKHLCGGTLIARRWVVTAAHCVRSIDFGKVYLPSKISIFIGNHSLDSQESALIVAERIVSHPDFDYETNQNDIALIKLSRAYAAPLVSIPKKGTQIPNVDEEVTVLGWGAIDEGSSRSSTLKEASLTTIRNAACFPYFPNILDSRLSFCTRGNSIEIQDSCAGDSGGPSLVFRNNTYILAGIISFGAGCARSGVPSVYTRVELYADWVGSVISGTFESRALTVDQRKDHKPIFRIRANSSISGSLLAGTVNYYDVTGSEKIILISNTGDADLYIINDATFQDISAKQVQCMSESTEEKDICVINNSKNGAYAVVFGFVDTQYTITAELTTNDGVSPE